MPNFIDLTGKRFGKLTVLGKAPKTKKYIIWLCLCDCGKETSVSVANLANGHTKSCGCSVIDKAKENFTTHHMSKERIYKIWVKIKHRCLNSNYPAWKNYGGRGIGISDEWLIFDNFYNDMNSSYDDSLTIDRIDNEKGYSKENCRWANIDEQANNKRSNILVEINGATDTLSRQCRKHNLNYHIVYKRIKSGWSMERAIATPSRVKNKYVKAEAN